jgi:hypothetical protein
MRAIISRRNSRAFRELSVPRLTARMLFAFGSIPCAWSSVDAISNAKGSGWRLVTVFAMCGLLGLIYGICRRYVFRYLHNRRTERAFEAPSAASHGAGDPCGQISIYREGAYADKHRSYTVLFDERAVGEILPDESRTFTVQEGKHVVVIKIDWAESNALVVDVPRQSLQRLRVRSNVAGLRVVFAMWYALFRRKSYLKLEAYQTNT